LYPVPVAFNGRVGAFVYEPLGVVRALKDFRPDVVQIEAEAYSLAAFELSIIAKTHRKQVVLFSWENIDRSISVPRRLSRRVALALTDGAVCGNRDNENLLRRCGFRGTAVVLPQFGVDMEVFHPRLRRDGNGNQNFTVGFVGRLVPEKGIDVLLRAVATLRKTGVAISVLVCGAGATEPLQGLAEEIGIADRVQWRNAVLPLEVPQLMSQLDVLVLPSRTTPHWKEQFGHVLIEAMAMAIPVVGSNSGEIPQVIGREDLLFPEGNFEALAEILATLVADPSSRQEAGNWLRQRVSEKFSHEAIARQLLAFYDSLEPTGALQKQAMS
jgi:glycosyltransferase involved in cell wall biosynthesis